MGRRVCPGCEGAMQVFHADGVEVDRCGFCGGVWLDGGELAKLQGQPLAVKPTRGVTRRRCAGCGTTMSAASLRGMAVESCASCQGVYLDDGELQAALRRQVPLRAAAEAQTPRALTFMCGGCGSRKPVDEGLATSGGLSCSNCYAALSYQPTILTSPYRTRAIAYEGIAGILGVFLDN